MLRIQSWAAWVFQELPEHPGRRRDRSEPTIGEELLLNPGAQAGGYGGYDVTSSGASVSAGTGGGSVVILAQGAITVAAGGVIQANGGPGRLYTPSATFSGGGGGGGIIVLASKTSISGGGTLSAQGGPGATGSGGGGGGIVIELATSISGNSHAECQRQGPLAQALRL